MAAMLVWYDNFTLSSQQKGFRWLMVPRSRVKGSIIYKVEERGHSKNIIFYPGTETTFINCNNTEKTLYCFPSNLFLVHPISFLQNPNTGFSSMETQINWLIPQRRYSLDLSQNHFFSLSEFIQLMMDVKVYHCQ